MVRLRLRSLRQEGPTNAKVRLTPETGNEAKPATIAQNGPAQRL